MTEKSEYKVRNFLGLEIVTANGLWLLIQDKRFNFTIEGWRKKYTGFNLGISISSSWYLDDKSISLNLNLIRINIDLSVHFTGNAMYPFKEYMEIK